MKYRLSPLLFGLIAMLAVSAPAIPPQDHLSPGLRKVLESPLFQHSPWALYVVDMDKPGVVYESYHPDMLLDPASTTKLFTVAAALHTLGPDHRFKTPVYATAPVGPQGELEGDLVLVADGDLCLGGRTLPHGEIEFTNMDHCDANALGNCQLTSTNPLQGLDELARQVASHGIKTVRGEVVIDDRLFGVEKPFNPELDYRLTSIMVNDNVIDLIVKPGANGAPASLDYRPKSAAYTVQSSVTTGTETQLQVSSPSPGLIRVQGEVAAGSPVVRTFPVDDPAAFARTCFIEALGRAGVKVKAATTGPNPAARLPASRSGQPPVALLESPPFSQFARLILKVSHNPGADTCLLLMAAHHGQRTMEEGLAVERAFLQEAGVDINGLVLNDGQGSFGAAFAAPRAVVQLLHYMTTASESKEYFQALPVLGVDGSLATLMADTPLKGKVQAKTGTHAGPNGLHPGLWISRALGGTMTTKSGKRLLFDVVVGTVPAAGMQDIQRISTEHGRVLQILYDQY